MKRVLCVWLPDFPIQRLNNDLPETKAAACALYVESGNRAQVVIASVEARRHGVHAGMTLAEAQALTGAALFLPHDVDADSLELKNLAGLCCDYSPFVGLELSNQTHCLMLDISGCGHLFGDDSGLARQLVVDLADRGYFAHVAVANTIGAAWAIARYGHCTGSDRRLRSLPVEALRIPDKLVTQLREFDLQKVGQLSALPKDSLPARFGTVLNERLDQLFGRRDELIEPVPQREPVFAQWTTEESICSRQAIQYVCPNLLAEILDTLKSRSMGLLRLSLRFENESSAAISLEVGLARPTNSLPHVLKLLELKLETSKVPTRLHTVFLEASAVSVISTRQRGLFEIHEPDSNRGEVRQLLDRLSTRLGQDAVVRPHLLPEAVPEQAVGFASLKESASKLLLQVNEFPACARPLVLFSRPESVSVTAAPDTILESFYWQRHHQVVKTTRAERIETAWWQDAGFVRRDYFQMETQTGARFWLFRDSVGEWFLHGVFE